MSQKRKTNPALMGFAIGMHVALLLLLFMLPWLLQSDSQATGASGGEEGIEISLDPIKEVQPEPDPVQPEPEVVPPPPPPPEPEPTPEPEPKVEKPEEKLTEDADKADLQRKKEEEELKKKEEVKKKEELKKKEKLKTEAQKKKELAEKKAKELAEVKKKEAAEKAKKEAAEKAKAAAEKAEADAKAKADRLKAMGKGIGPGQGKADTGKPGFGDGNGKSDYDGDLKGILGQLWEKQDVSNIEARAGAKVHVLLKINRDGSLLVKTITSSEDPAMKAAVENLLRQLPKAPPLPATYLGGTYTFETFFTKTDE